jgi:hypothetical protein
VEPALEPNNLKCGASDKQLYGADALRAREREAAALAIGKS